MAERNHSWYIEILERHVDGDLEPQLQSELFQHLEVCEECRRMWEAEQRLMQRLREVPRLVVPSDFRAQMVQRAAREHFERKTPLVDDPRYAALFSADEDEELLGDEALTSLAGLADEDIPVFAGLVRPAPSALRRAWRKASPVAAYGFLSIAAVGAFLTADMHGIPGFARAQDMARGTLSGLVGLDSGAPLERASDAPDGTLARPNNSRIRDNDMRRPGQARIEQLTASIDLTKDTIENMVAALARAAEGNYPSPAERARPQISALVIRATDRTESFSLDDDEFERALAEAAVGSAENRADVTEDGETPDHAVAQRFSRDQFNFENHRYRTYVVPVSESGLNEIIDRLDPYKVAPNEQVVRAINAQTPLQSNALSAKQTLFVEAQSAALRDALIVLAKKEPGGSRHPRAVKLVVVY